MKMKIVFVMILSLFVVSCAKSLADEQGFYDPNYHLRSTGSSAKEMLTDSIFKSLKIEVHYMPGAEPDSVALVNLKKFLAKHLHKPGGITITSSEVPASADSVFNLQDVMTLEEQNRKQFSTNNELAVYVLYVNGNYNNHQTLGYAYRNTSIVMFGSHIRANSDRYKKPGRSYLETRVLQHEFGHLMGLVNVGTTAQDDHHDQEQGAHCTNKFCLMYHLADTNDYPLVLTKGTPPALDKACLADLRANGGK